jgi:hypothetical protein
VFDEFAPDMLAAMPAWVENSHAGSVCSCTILLNMTLWRDPAAPLLPSTLIPSTQHSAISAEPFAAATRDGVLGLKTPADFTYVVKWDPHAPMIEDQGVMHVLWTYLRPRFLRLRQDWDVSNCARWYGADPTLGRDDGDSETDTMHGQVVRPEMLDIDGLIVPGIVHM